MLLLAASVALVAAATMAPAAIAGAITTVAGNGRDGFSGDGGPATAARLFFPVSVAVTADGGLLIADRANHRIRKVARNGTITTVAGKTSNVAFSGDGGPATAADLYYPTDAEPTPDGGFLISDSYNNRIRKVSAGGTITTIAGTGSDHPGGDGGPAAAATFSPRSIALTPDGGYLLVDDFNNQIRKVSAGGTITTVAGSSHGGYGGDGGPATSAMLFSPGNAAPTPDGGFLIADTNNHRVRKVSAGGTITTVAGNGTRGFSGDGGPATRARLYEPEAVAAAGDGGFLIADRLNHRIRKVSADGTIRTVAGTGTPASFGDGGPPTLASVFGPRWVASTADGGFLIADSETSRIRKVNPGPDPPPLVCGAARGNPRVGRTVVVRRLRGAVFLKRPRSRSVRLRGSATIPVGSTVDTTGGRVKLVSATCRAGVTKSGVFYGAPFVVRQDRHTAVTDLRLTGLGPCNGQLASAARRRRVGLHATAHGGHSTSGGYSAGTVRGTSWVTEDTCQATTTEVKHGEVVVVAKGDFPQTYTLDHPGDRISVFCTTRGPAAAPFYCLTMFKAGRERNTFSFSDFEHVLPKPASFEVCVSGPGLSKCFHYDIDPQHAASFTKVACSPRQAGVFTTRWRVAGRLMGTLQSPRMPGGGNNGCKDIS
jgi:DNA-binding beta-propeller fold protein YncE